MTTAFRPPTKETRIRDIRGAAAGAARFAELRVLARLNAEATAIVYRATGTVSRDVIARLRQWVYAVRAGRVELGRDFVPMLDVLAGGVGRTMGRLEAREAAERLLALGQQLIDLKLSGPDDPAQDRTMTTQCLGTDRESCRSRRGAAERLHPMGSIEADGAMPKRAA